MGRKEGSEVLPVGRSEDSRRWVGPLRESAWRRKNRGEGREDLAGL